MPDLEGKQKGRGTKTPDNAYKQGRPEDVQEGSLGVDTGGDGVQRSRLTDGADGDEPGTAQVGGFAGQQADDSPDAGTVEEISERGDPSPHAEYDTLKKDEAAAAGQGDSGPLPTGEGAMDQAPGSLGNDGPDEVGRRGYGQQPDYDATDPRTRQRQPHPRTPSDMGR